MEEFTTNLTDDEKKLFSCLQRGYTATQARLPNVTNVTTID